VEIRANPLPGKPQEFFPGKLARIPHVAEDPQAKILEIQGRQRSDVVTNEVLDPLLPRRKSLFFHGRLL